MVSTTLSCIMLLENRFIAAALSHEQFSIGTPEGAF